APPPGRRPRASGSDLLSAKTKPDLPGYLLQINLKQANGRRHTPPPENLNFLHPTAYGRDQGNLT
ncbi:hypothetical protein, partial [Acetobacter sp.]|uniref:hypothetical protein n=1 Tax=Acetobacter sp. TaxID=440 RepID=UPI0039ED8755